MTRFSCPSGPPPFVARPSASPSIASRAQRKESRRSRSMRIASDELRLIPSRSSQRSKKAVRTLPGTAAPNIIGKCLDLNDRRPVTAAENGDAEFDSLEPKSTPTGYKPELGIDIQEGPNRPERISDVFERLRAILRIFKSAMRLTHHD